MKTTRWVCDRCQEPIVVGRVTIEVMTGPERRRRPELDLCPACATGLWSWIDSAAVPVARPSPGPGPGRGDSGIGD